jgi:hypothetical protein
MVDGGDYGFVDEGTQDGTHDEYGDTDGGGVVVRMEFEVNAGWVQVWFLLRAPVPGLGSRARARTRGYGTNQEEQLCRSLSPARSTYPGPR